MTNLEDIIKLAEADGGKFFVIDTKGEAKLVIMGVEENQKLLLGKLQRQIKEQAEDIEKINQEILQAQLKEQDADVPNVPKPQPRRRAPYVLEGQAPTPGVDLRAEVIDPSFDFEGPKMADDDL